MSNRIQSLIAAKVALVVMLGAVSAQAETPKIQQRFQALIEQHAKVKAAVADRQANEENVKSAEGAWFPTLSVLGNYGGEAQQTNGVTETQTHLQPKEVDFTLTQKLWDFGSTNSLITRAEHVVGQAQEIVLQTEQDILLEGLNAQMGVISSRKVLRFRLKSESNIKKQTELEDARVQLGSGFSTDVLQAKTQLAGAQAARVRAEGEMVKSLNRYRAVFESLPEDFNTLEVPAIPGDLLPKSLEEALRISLEENHQVKAARFLADVRKEETRKSEADNFYPTINAVASSIHKHDVAGTVGRKTENLVKVEASYTINTALTAINTLKASEYTEQAAILREKDTLTLVEQQVRNSWQGLETAKANLEFLQNQSNIAAEFLDLARNERKLGLRTLIDVLAGETALINAQSEAALAEAAYVVASFSLLNDLGRLRVDSIRPAPPVADNKKAPAAEPPAPKAAPVAPVERKG